MTGGSPPQQGRKRNLATRPLLILVASIIWCFTLVKLFVLDVDVLLLRAIAPTNLWLLDFKFFYLGAMFLLFWLLAPKSLFWKTMLFVFFYPAILVFWLLPKRFFTSWPTTFVIVFGIFSSLVALKSRTTLWFIAALSSILIVFSSNRHVIAAAMAGLFVYPFCTCYVICA